MSLVFGWVLASAFGFVHSIYNAWAVTMIWNTWLAHLHILTWPETFGGALLLAWTRAYTHRTDEEMAAYVPGYLKYELLQPITLVTVSYLLHLWFY
jgi:hypothetical protein